MRSKVLLFLVIKSAISAPLEDAFCRPIDVGKRFLEFSVILDSSPCVLSIYRGNHPLSSGDQYIPGEILSVRLSLGRERVSQFLIDITGGSFVGSECSGTRVTNADIIDAYMPMTGQVAITAAYVDAYGISIIKTSTLFLTDMPVSPLQTYLNSASPFDIEVTVTTQGLKYTNLDTNFLTTIKSLAISYLEIDGTNVFILKKPPYAMNATAAIIIKIHGLTTAKIASTIATSLITMISSKKFLLAIKGVQPQVTACTITSVSSVDATDSYDHSCKLGGEMRLYWSILNGGARMKVIVSSSYKWFSFGVIQPPLLAISKSLPHSVFLFSPAINFVGKFLLLGMTVDKFPLDNRPGNTSELIYAHADANSSYMVMRYSNAVDQSGDMTINSGGTNYAIWSQSIGNWPSYHKYRGFVLIDWSKGTCIQPSGLSPFLVFITIGCVLVIVHTPLVRLTPIQILLKRRIPFFEEYSYAGGVVVLIHLVISLIVSGSSFIVLRMTYHAAVIATGKLAVMSFWISLMLSSKTLFYFTTVPFERLLKYHKLASCLAFIGSLVHGILNAVYHTGRFFSQTPFNGKVVPLYGAMAFLCTCAIVVFSIESIRRANYEVFLLFHMISPAIVIFLILHVDFIWIGFVPGLLLQTIDIIARLYKSITSKHSTIARVGEITVLEVTSTSSYRIIGGEYFFVSIKFLGKEWHPFSLSGARDGNLTFHIQTQNPGSWTHRLHSCVVEKCSIHLDGPYGCIPLKCELYDSVYFIVGGIGITAFLNLLELIDSNHNGFYDRIISITIFWSMKGPDLYNIFRHRITVLNRIQMKLQVYNTLRGSNFDELFVINDRMSVEANIKVIRSHEKQSCLLICGPPGLSRAAAFWARTYSVDFHFETFAY
jgi:NAD(P)H-flavin reductase